MILKKMFFVVSSGHVLFLVVLLSALPVMAVTHVVNPGDNLAQIIWNAAEGDTVLVNEGTYIAQPTDYTPFDPVFHVIRNITLKAAGRREATILQVGSGNDQIIKVHPASYTTTTGLAVTTNPDGAVIEGFTLIGDQGGVLARDYQMLNGGSVQNIVLRNLDITVSTSNGTHGIELNNVSNAVVAGCVVRSAYANGIYVYQGRDNIIIDNSILYTATQHGIAIQDSTGNQVAGNSITGAAHAGVIMLNTTGTRIADNDISGFGVDGITITDGSKFNLVQSNNVVSDGWAAGRADGTGIWLNCNANFNLIAGNSVTGNPENGLTIFAASNNLLEGNHTWNNYHGGIFIWDNNEFCYDPNAPGETPVSNYLMNNYAHYNAANAQINIRGGHYNQVACNHLDGRDSLNGILAGSNTGGIILQTSSGNTVYNNTISHLNNGEYIYSDVSSTTFSGNRHFDTTLRYAFSPAQVSWDAGPVLGGNFWNDFAAIGNPSSGTPYTDFVIDSIGNRGGDNIDNYPYQSESLGREAALRILKPQTGQLLARGSRKTIRWQSSACVYVDLAFVTESGAITSIAANYPDTGFYVWGVPDGLALGRGYIQVDCKDSAGNDLGASAWSGSVTVTDNALVLLAPGGQQAVSAGNIMRVAWRQEGSDPVDVVLRFRDGSESVVAAGVTGGFADITVPSDHAGRATVRVTTAGGLGDESDGPLFIRRENGATVLTPVVGERLRPGQITEIVWLSPPDSAIADIEVWNGSSWQPVANAYPDWGRFRWLVPALSTDSAQLRISFRTLTGGPAGNAVQSGQFSVSSDVTTGGPCTAGQEGTGPLSLPVISYAGANLTAQLGFLGLQQGQYLFDVEGYNFLDDISGYSSCRPATLTEELELFVPSVLAGGQLIHTTLGVQQENGSLRFRLLDYGTGNAP